MRVSSLIKLKPEYEERYIILHRHTFPGVLDRIRKSHIRNYSIFLMDGMLFSYYEYVGDDYNGDMAKIGQDQVTQEWWKLTDPMQDPIESRKDGSIVFEAEVAGTKEIKYWVLTWGAKAVVLAPKSLRDEIRAEATAMLQMTENGVRE